MTAQLELFPADVEVVATRAMQRGETHVVQCSWCGLLVCAARAVELRPCPACDKWGGWWVQTLPVGPFLEAGHAKSCASRGVGAPECDCTRGAAKGTPSAAPSGEG
ncbi:hypothetical protein BO221_04815 [Archangium sp. Cb G35]|nr:hypothetical protein BO221_04815 [Archangium sp. Cb G35]